jgi:TolA-binding protein
MAYSHFNLKDFANSVFYFNEFIKLYKRDANVFDAKRRLAESYYGIKQFSSSSAVYDELFANYKSKINSSFIYYNYAQALFKSGSPDKAITKLAELQSKYPRSKYADDSQYLIGWIHFQQAEYPQAISNYEKVFIKYPNSPIKPIALYSIGDSHFNLAQYDSAIVFYKMLIEKYPKTQFVNDAVNGIQYCYIAQDKPNEAIKVIDDYVSKNSGSSYGEKILFKKGEIYYSQGKYEDAVAGYMEFISSYPKSDLVSDANYWIGKSQLLVDKKDEALESFIKVTEQDIESEFGIAAVIEICNIYEQQNEFDAAISVYKNAIESIPQSPKIPELMYNKGMLEVKKEDLPEAYKTFNEISKYYSQSLFAAKANIELGLLELKRGGYENSKMLFSEVGSNRTDDIGAEAQYYYGVTLFEEGNYVDAISALVRVRSVFPGYMEWYTKSLLKLGDCYVKLGNEKNAREMYRAVLKHHKNNEYAKEANEKIKSL